MGVIAAVQMCSNDQLPQNLERLLNWIALAAKRGAKLVVFPENCLYFGPHLQQSQQLLPEQQEDSPPPSLNLDSPELKRVQAASDLHQIDVVLGSIPEAIEKEEKRGNTMLLFYAAEANRPKIAPVRYQKIHLFDVTLQNGERYQESATFQAGTEIKVAHSRLGHLGMSICYDLRFPELYRGLVARGAQVFLVPAAFTEQTGKDHWHVLLRSRAIENLAFVVAPAQAGSPYPERQVYGHSLILDPWGNTLAEAKGEGEEMLIADLNLDYQRHIRQIFPALTHRKLFTERT